MKRQIRLPRNINEVLSGILQTRVSERGIPVPPGWDIYVTDSNKGYARSNSQTCTVPLWSYRHDDPDHAIYYIAHELAHAWTYVNGGDVQLHGRDFYKEFKRLCPPQLWHFELAYKTRDARRAGIDPDPKRNIVSALPDAPAAAYPTTKTYGRAATYDTEGDLYEGVTGHRSSVIDISELVREAIARDPKIEKRIKQQRTKGATDDNVKSYVRGWFNKGSKV